MPLDSWIDDDAVAMLRALSPRMPDNPATGVIENFAGDIFVDSGLLAAPLPGDLPIPAAAEPVVRPMARPAPVPVAPEPAADPVDSLTAPRIMRTDDPAPEAIARLRQTLAAIRRRAELDGVVRVAAPADHPAGNLPPAVSAAVHSEPVPAPPMDAATGVPDVPVAANAAFPILPDGPLSARLALWREWMQARHRIITPVLMDRRGGLLHAPVDDNGFAAAAFARGCAWRISNPKSTQAIHAAWGNAIMVVVPVPTRFGD